MSAVIDSAQTRTRNDSLNGQQREAACFGMRTSSGRFESGPLLIIAGAGTGKTNTLAHRVAHLRLNGVNADRILLLTFTRRASEEMTRRAERIVQQAWMSRPPRDRTQDLRTKLLWAGTFHSIANRLLRVHAYRLGLDSSFSVLDRGDSADLMDVVRHDLGMAKKEKRFPRKDTCLAIYSHKINTQWPLKRTLEENFPWCAEWEDDLTTLFRKFVDVKQQQQVLDYDDLLLYWHFAVQDAAFAQLLSEQFDHVLVDEYQDTNTLQADILFAMRPSGDGLCVVGDDAQSIYSFRAASVENILNFPARFSPPAHIAKLEKNYRSVQPILDAANSLISEGTRQYQKRLYSDQSSQQKPHYVSVADDQAQADYIVDRVLATRETGVALKEQAVLMRSSHHSDVLEVELVRRNIPYVKYGGLKFLEASHVKDVLAVLKWFVTELTLDPPQVTGDLSGPPLLDEDYLILSTIHSSKGQEWDSVYLLNVADGNFPNEFSAGKPALLEEERRLLYVAMTRAKQSLHLVAPLKYYVTQQARMGDRHVYGAKSRFISESLAQTLDSTCWPKNTVQTRQQTRDDARPQLDIAKKMQRLWD